MLRLRASVYIDGSFAPMEIRICEGIIESIEEISAGEKTEAMIFPPLANGHAHTGDAFIREEIKDITGDIMKIVAPPDGLKHRRLREAAPEEIVRGMVAALREMEQSGIRRFMDFREQGRYGVELLKEALDNFNEDSEEKIEAVILGRPEGCGAEEVLELADGLGISSISDYPWDNILEWRKAAEKKGKIFALHASERIREDINRIIELRPHHLVHMTEATDDDLKRCAEEKIPVVITPTSNLFFGKIPPVRRMLDAGVKVALGTDNLMLSYPSIIDEMRILYELGREGGRALSREEILRIGIDNTRELLGMKEWRPEEGEKWDGVILKGCLWKHSHKMVLVDDNLIMNRSISEKKGGFR